MYGYSFEQVRIEAAAYATRFLAFFQEPSTVKGEVLLTLWDTFKANHVTIPFPQREVTVRMAEAARPFVGSADVVPNATVDGSEP